MHYFGAWADPDSALTKYLDQKDALHAGRKPRQDSGKLTVKDAANAYLNAAQTRLEAGELSARSWADYKATTDLMVSELGKSRLVADLDPSDFTSMRSKWAKKWGPYRLAKTVQVIRSLFKLAFDAGLIPTPVRFGPGFKGPSKKTVRLHRAEKGAKLFSAGEIHQLIEAATVPMRAMFLLAINCGFGNGDCAHLPLSALDLETGWIDYPRPKTGINRHCPLWRETIEALRAVLDKRPTPKDKADAGLIFITKYGLPWGKETADNPITKETAKLLRDLGIKRNGVGFYSLRHTFRTVADEAKDQPAVDHIMGHEVQHMSAIYRERIADARLKAVTDYVRSWLFAEEKDGAKNGEEE
jgi:integrase